MNCVNCGYMLPSSNIKSCPLCGIKFPESCHYCGQPNPSLAKFCFNCGSRIIREGIESSIQNFDVLSEKRKNVAVMFADVSGFTALSEKMDPEEVREIINDCFEYITKPIYQLEGTIDKYIGDCIMILFGARYSHGDDPRRAVTCALRMLDLIDEFSEERLSEKGLKLNLSIGVNFGLVVTGSVGNYFDKDYTVMGDVVNVAQRLQSSADQGKILVAESVYQETKDLIQYSGPWEIMVKNKEKPVVCYSPSGYKIMDEYDDLYLVQRDKEVNFLFSIFENARTTRCITVSGEAGIGKTSLIGKFVSQIGKDVKIIRVDCSSIYQNRVNYIMSNILHGILNITPESLISIKKSRILSYIGYILSDCELEVIQKNYNFISLVMGLERDKEFQEILNSMHYNDIEREILNQLTLFFSTICRKDPFVFILEDFQWSDKSSRKILKQIIESLSEARTLFVFSTRSEAEGLEFIDRNLHDHMRLGPLDMKGIDELVCRMLYCSKTDMCFLDQIMKFTSGNPLYIKEFINLIKRKNHFLIKDNTAYIKELEIFELQNTMENMILSNLSDLDEGSTRFLQIASVIGKEFNLTWVARLLNEPSIEEKVVCLLQLNIISLKSVSTSAGKVEKIYTFTQEPLREVIYGSILNRSKKSYHKMAAEYIESNYSNELEKYYEILCVHYKNAGLDKKAAQYYYKTALKYKNDFNLGSSLEYYELFIRAAEKFEDKNAGTEIVHAYMDTGYIHIILANYEYALKQLDSALKAAVHSEDVHSIKLMISRIHMGKGLYNEALEVIDDIAPKIRENSSIFGQLLQLKCSILRIQGNTKALTIAEKAEEILTKARDYESLSETMRQAGILYFVKGETENSLFYLNKAYSYAEKINNLAAMASSSGNLGIIYHASGRISKALEYFTKSIMLSKKISNRHNYISGNINLGILFLDKGLFDKAEALFEESLQGSRQVSSVLYECAALTNLGDVMYERGDFKKSWMYYEQSLSISIKHGLPVEEGINYIGMAKVHFKLGALEKVPIVLEKSWNLFRDADEISYLSDYNRYMSVYMLASRNTDRALFYCEEAISKAGEAKNDLRKLKCLRLKGNILAGTGKFSEAIEAYSQAIVLSVQLESDYEASKSYYRRFTAYKAEGLLHEAQKDLHNAREASEKIDRSRWTAIINSE